MLPEWIAGPLIAAQEQSQETAAVLLVSVAEVAPSTTRMLGRELHFVSEESYALRTDTELDVTSSGYVQALQRAEEIGASAIWVHTHTGADASAKPSEKDAIVDDRVAEVFRNRTGSDYYGTLIVGRRRGQATFTGTLVSSTERRALGRLSVSGDHLMFLNAEGSLRSGGRDPIFDRNIRAFGGDVQRVLGELRVAVVGCGGTGSAVAEQLVRLGVRHLDLVDPEQLAESNVTRVYGSTPRGVGKGKASLLARHLRRIAPTAQISARKSTITRERTARRLTGSDVIFGCTDDNAGRLILSRLSSYYLTPVIDCGVVLTSGTDGRLRGIDGRVTIMSPGAGCLVCRGRVDLARAASEMLTPDERTRREDEGYARALPGVEPAVVAFTTLVASIAVSELIERLVGYGDVPTPNEILLRLHDREMSTNTAQPRVGHYCHPGSGKLGLGDADPFLEQTWVA